MPRSKFSFVLPLIACAASLHCGGERGTPQPRTVAATPLASHAPIGYDIRRLRPVDGETLVAMFERLRDAAVRDRKQVAVLFSADWCEPCRILDLELGNTHPAESIGHVRILELKEEEWDAATRMDEFNELRRRWFPALNTYPLFLVLDERGEKREEMQEAIERLGAAGVDPTIVLWFESLRTS